MCGRKTVSLQHIIREHRDTVIHSKSGKWGENTIVDYLYKQGYTIRERGWRHGKFEIDVIALSPDGITCMFVKAKTRRPDEVALPSDAVDEKKMRNLGIVADVYVKMFDIQEELCSDVISIVGSTAEDMQIEHFEDASNPVLLQPKMRIKLVRLNEADPTNAYLCEHADRSNEELVVVQADYQTSGKGQEQNGWEGQAGKNLLYSLLVHPQKLPVKS